MSDQLDQCRADMVTFLDTYEWGESTLTRKRMTTTYDSEGKAVQDWDSLNVSMTGDYQPLNGSDIRAESGRTDKSDAKIEVEYDVDILSGDRVLRSANVFWHVNYVRDHEDHQVVFVRKLRNATDG